MWVTGEAYKPTKMALQKFDEGLIGSVGLKDNISFDHLGIIIVVLVFVSLLA